MLCEEKDAEIERMRTTLEALKEKLVVFNDLEQELQNRNESFILSEKQRAKMQENMEDTAKKIEEDAKFHKDTHEKLKLEIQDLVNQVAKEREE